MLNNKCPICLEEKELTEGHDKHLFCKDCYDPIKLNNKCPLCRIILDKNLSLCKLNYIILIAFFTIKITNEILTNDNIQKDFPTQKERANFVKILKVRYSYRQ